MHVASPLCVFAARTHEHERVLLAWMEAYAYGLPVRPTVRLALVLAARALVAIVLGSG